MPEPTQLHTLFRDPILAEAAREIVDLYEEQVMAGFDPSRESAYMALSAIERDRRTYQTGLRGLAGKIKQAVVNYQRYHDRRQTQLKFRKSCASWVSSGEWMQFLAGRYRERTTATRTEQEIVKEAIARREATKAELVSDGRRPATREEVRRLREAVKERKSLAPQDQRVFDAVAHHMKAKVK